MIFIKMFGFMLAMIDSCSNIFVRSLEFECRTSLAGGQLVSREGSVVEGDRLLITEAKAILSLK